MPAGGWPWGRGAMGDVRLCGQDAMELGGRISGGDPHELSEVDVGAPAQTIRYLLPQEAEAATGAQETSWKTYATVWWVQEAHCFLVATNAAILRSQRRRRLQTEGGRKTVESAYFIAGEEGRKEVGLAFNRNNQDGVLKQIQRFALLNDLDGAVAEHKLGPNHGVEGHMPLREGGTMPGQGGSWLSQNLGP